MKLAELATTSALIGILSTACAVLVHAQTQLLRNVSDRVAGAEALRTASGIVTAEVRSTAAADVHAIAADSLALRVHRGMAVVAAVADDGVTLDYEGIRDPDPAKDSLVIVGTERVGSFTLLAGETLRIRPDVPVRERDILLFFESGAYHLATNALRYRRGAEGRQPVTDELIDHRASRFGVEAQSSLLRIHLQARNSRIRAAAQTNTRVRLINRTP
jgi:hypothetical protein